MQSKFYPLIVDSKYRIWRHLLFILTLAIITFNQVFISYQDCMPQLGNRLYIICLVSFSTYLVSTYLNYFLLIPRLLLKENYMTYILYLLLIVFILLYSGIILEYTVRTYLGLPHRIQSYTNPLIFLDSLSNSMITVICFWSMSALTLFRQWKHTNDHIITLEYQFLESEVNKLKGQVSPIFLSKALKKASSLTNQDAKKVAEILMQIGKILRYQLYDCDQEKVFLNSEITFIKNFLILNDLISDQHFEYQIEVSGNTSNILIPPLLLIVLPQHILNNNTVTALNISIETVNNKLEFNCYYSEDFTISNEDKIEVVNKLNKLYPDLYNLTTQSGKVELQLDLK